MCVCVCVLCWAKQNALLLMSRERQNLTECKNGWLCKSFVCVNVYAHRHRHISFMCVCRGRGGGGGVGGECVFLSSAERERVSDFLEILLLVLVCTCL